MSSKEEIENNIKEKDSSVVETERIIIEIPKNTNYLSLVCFFTDKDGFNVNNQILGIKPIKEKKEELEQLETENKELKAEIAEQVYFGSMPIEEIKQLQAKVNKYDSLIKEIEDKIKEIGEYSDIARELIEEKIVVADSDSLNFGRQQAHNKDREVLRELLYKQKKEM